MYVLYILKHNTHVKATPGFLYKMILIQIDILIVDIVMKTILFSCHHILAFQQWSAHFSGTKVYADIRSRKSQIRKSNSDAVKPVWPWTEWRA